MKMGEKCDAWVRLYTHTQHNDGIDIHLCGEGGGLTGIVCLCTIKHIDSYADGQYTYYAECEW